MVWSWEMKRWRWLDQWNETEGMLPKKDSVREDMKSFGLSWEDAQDRYKWRK